MNLTLFRRWTLASTALTPFGAIRLELTPRGYRARRRMFA